MVTHEAQAGRSPAGRARPHRLLPIVGSTVAVAAVLAHLGGGAVLMHLGGGAVLAYLGFGWALASPGALVVGLAALVGLKLLLVIGARRWLRHRSVIRSCCAAQADDRR